MKSVRASITCCGCSSAIQCPESVMITVFHIARNIAQQDADSRIQAAGGPESNGRNRQRLLSKAAIVDLVLPESAIIFEPAAQGTGTA